MYIRVSSPISYLFLSWCFCCVSVCFIRPSLPFSTPFTQMKSYGGLPFPDKWQKYNAVNKYTWRCSPRGFPVECVSEVLVFHYIQATLPQLLLGTSKHLICRSRTNFMYLIQPSIVGRCKVSIEGPIKYSSWNFAHDFSRLYCRYSNKTGIVTLPYPHLISLKFCIMALMDEPICDQQKLI